MEAAGESRIEQYIQQAVDRRWKEKEEQLRKEIAAELKERKGLLDNQAQMRTPNRNANSNYASKQANGTSKGRNIWQNNLKSPSDTTLYTPGLQRTPEQMAEKIDRSLIDKISEFVETVRVTGNFDREGRVQQRVNQRGKQPTPGTLSANKDDEADARSAADQMILEAEKFRAAVNAPQGMQQNYYLDRNKLFVGVVNDKGGLMDDDEFFHIMCHVEPALRLKIENGEFVDLEKQLTKEIFKNRSSEDGRLEFFNKDGHTYLAPANREMKITNVRRWEQAFRVYVTIYSKANPARATEIWQYV